MLTAAQFRLLKLAEECTEVGKECSKLIIGGPENVYEGRKTKELLEDEILDVLIVVRLLQMQGVIRKLTKRDVQKHYAAKHDKIMRKTHDMIGAGILDARVLDYTPAVLP